MSKKEKLIKRLLSLPKDFNFNELTTIMLSLGFEIENKGKTSGSRIKFYFPKKKIQYLAHKPHPKKIIKEKALKDIVNFLTENKLI